MKRNGTSSPSPSFIRIFPFCPSSPPVRKYIAYDLFPSSFIPQDLPCAVYFSSSYPQFPLALARLRPQAYTDFCFLSFVLAQEVPFSLRSALFLRNGEEEPGYTTKASNLV